MLRLRLAIAFAIGTVSAAQACKPVELSAAPDAHADDRVCAHDPIAFCDAMAPGAPGGCETSDSDAASKVIQGLPPNTSYPQNCVANLIVPTMDGDCRVSATCRCTELITDAGTKTPGWSCFP